MISIKRASLYLIAASILCSVFTFFILKHYLSKKFEEEEMSLLKQQEDCGSTVFRLSGYKYIKPFLFGDKNCESAKLSGLKSQLSEVIESYKFNNEITNASVYLRDFKTGGGWIAVNGNETYNPGSLIKVPILITYLRMEELKPGTLDMQFLFEGINGKMPTQHFSNVEIQVGKSYSVRQLLRNMIVNSDNYATYVLNQHLDVVAFKKLFTDLGLPEPDEHSATYPITAKQMSTFFKVLYNAGYLTISNSEYATALLGESEFGDGLVKGLPQDISVAHKFGEAGNNQIHELHDAGIIYINQSPYFIAVMTKGNDLKKLPEVISGISKIVFENMKGV